MLTVRAWFLVPFAVLYAIDRNKPMAGSALLWPWLYATTIAACAHTLFTTRDRSFVAPRWLVLPAALFVLRVIAYGTNTGAYLHAVAQGAVYVLLPLVVFQARALRLVDVRRVLVVPLVVILAGSFFGIFRHQNPFAYGDVLGSALGHRNFTSVFLAACLPLLLTWGRAPGSILATLSVYVILVNRTRSAWLMLIVYAAGIALVFYWSRAPRVARLARRAAIGFVVALVCLVVVPTGLRWSTSSPYLTSLTTMTSLEASSGRDQIWRVTLSMIRAHPLRGIGSGNYAVHFDEYIAPSGADPKRVLGTAVGMNDYLQEASECGLLAGVVMLLIVVGVASLAVWRARRKRKWTHAILGLGPLAIAADALVDYPIGRVETTLLFFVPVALLFRDLGAPTLRVRRALFVGASVLASVLFTFLVARQTLSQLALFEYRATKDFDAYERHYRAWPWRREVDDLLVVRTYLASDRAGEALDFARARVRSWPNAPTSALALALAHEAHGELAAAADVYRKIFLGPGQCHPEAAAAYRRLIRTAPQHALPGNELPQCVDEGAPKHVSRQADVAWQQAQTFLTAWRGEPLFSANWSGRYRPYVWRAGEAVAVIGDLAQPTDDVDFFSPTPLSDDEILLSGSSGGREDRFDLYLYDRTSSVLSNLTSAAEANHGNACVLSSARMLSWRERRTQAQHFAVVSADGKLESRGDAGAPFDACHWIDARTMLGYARAKSGYVLSRCALEREPKCEPLTALRDVDDVLQLFPAPDGGVGVIARKKGAQFRRAYRIDASGSDLLPLGLVAEGDVLGIDGPEARIGLHGRYSLDVSPPVDGVVHAFARIGQAIYAIYSDPSAAKFLAVRTAHGFARLAPTLEASSSREPLEVWLRTPAGRSVQAFYFGPLDPSRVVVFWHGGPKENVSPRFNPYFDLFEEAGFGVLAVNYPGSTGRGAAFEALFTEEGALLDTVDATLAYLRENGVDTIVSWSVSTGEALQARLLDAERRVSAIVDEGGGRMGELRARAEAKRIPFFGIAGRFDPIFDPRAKIDFVYDGGHALLHLEHFTAMRRSVEPFLARAAPLDGTSPSANKASLVLDPGHEGNASDPNRAGTLREAALTFELATAILDECALDPPARLSRTGSASLVSRSEALARRAEAIKASATPAVSLHFNASDPAHKSENLASVLLPSTPDPQEVAAGARILDGLLGVGLGPKQEYPELSAVARRVAPGIFTRGGLAVLSGTARACRLLVEVAYYDDAREQERLTKRVLASDGAYVRPRVRELAHALCPAMRDVARCTKTANE